MAEQNFTGGTKQSPQWPALEMAHGHPMDIAIRQDASIDDIRTRLDNRLRMLCAMLNATYGTQGEAFRGSHDLMQDQYLWACSEMAEECLAMAAALEVVDRQ